MSPLLLFILLQFTACRCLQWAEMFEDDSGPIEVCSGQSIQLFWNFTLAKGENVKDMVWTCQPEGKATELLASYVDDTFVPMAEFSGRLSHLQDGGIELSCATILESGNYTVSVKTVDSTGTETLHRQTAFVKVVDTPKTQNGHLDVTQQRAAVRDDTSDGQWHVHLTCGLFSDRGHPPVDVEWKNPNGERLSSSYFHEGNFYLVLSNPVKGGKYTCSLPSLSPATMCLPTDSVLRDDVTVDVDEIAVRMSILEAGQTHMKNEMQAEMGRLRDAIAELKNESETLRLDSATQRIGFHAMLNQTFTGTGTLKPFTVITNEGGAFNGSSGIFTAPRNGTYFFTASAGPYSQSTKLDMRLQKEDVTVSRAIAGQYNDFWTMGSVQATLSLTSGQRVWLANFFLKGHVSFRTTSFTGFLIYAD